jgi:hypothetical protein
MRHLPQVVAFSTHDVRGQAFRTCLSPSLQVAQNLLPVGPINLLNLPTLGSVPLDTNLLGVQVMTGSDQQGSHECILQPALQLGVHNTAHAHH